MFSSVTNLHECTTVDQLYVYLGYNKDEISKFLYHGAPKYRSFTILKKNGGFREIVAPVKKLKEIQHKIKSELEKYYVPRMCVHGFVSGRNTVTNASSHVRKEFVLNIDLENFFGSINFGRVSRLFQSYPLHLPENVASVLAHICCHDGSLPQGAPTSPIISNMISYRLDRQLKELAKKNKCTYTRYADDITFSFTQRRRSLPKSIVILDHENNLTLGHVLKKIIEDNWFKLNESKNRIQCRTQRQSVTNVTVNSKINISKKFKKQTSAMINALSKYGPMAAELEYFQKYHKGYIPNRQLNKAHEKPGLLFSQIVRGRLNYMRLVCGETNDSWRKLMYKYTEAMGNPIEIYNKSWWEIAEDSTYIIYDIASKKYRSQGSGFFLENVGLVTNEHVIEHINNSNINGSLDLIWLPEEEKSFIELHLAWKDKDKDLAVITSQISFNDVTPLPVELNPNYEKDTEVYAIGYPAYDTRGINKATTLKAKITAIIKREGQKRIVIDQPIVHGHSGGVVLNSDAKVIGVVANGNAEGQISVTPSSFIPISTLLDEHNKRLKQANETN